MLANWSIDFQLCVQQLPSLGDVHREREKKRNNLQAEQREQRREEMKSSPAVVRVRILKMSSEGNNLSVSRINPGK